MNKYLFFFILIYCFISCKSKQEETPSVFSTINTFIISNDIEIRNKEVCFDSLGNCIREIYFGSREGDTISSTEHKYTGTLLLESIEKNSKGKIVETRIYNYENTYLKQNTIIKEMDTILRKKYFYYSNGKIKREVTEFLQDKITPIIRINNFDEHGNIEKIYDQIYEDSTKLVLGRYELTSYNYTYDSTNNRIIKTVATKLFGYYEIADTLFIAKFDYDSSGNLSIQHNIKKTSKESPDSIHYNYSENGDLINRISYFTSNSWADTVFYKFDNLGRKIGERNSTSGIEYRYVFSDY